jgi:hypothetical protein
MNDRNDIDVLKHKLSIEYNCSVRHIDTQHIWLPSFDVDVDVEVFELVNYPEAERCYAWDISPTADSNNISYSHVLGNSSIDSAEKAVRHYYQNNE